jgi:hypothetical protein
MRQRILIRCTVSSHRIARADIGVVAEPWRTDCETPAR